MSQNKAGIKITAQRETAAPPKTEVQRRRLVSVLTVFSLILHVITYQAYLAAVGQVGGLLGGMLAAGMVTSVAVLVMSLRPQPNFAAIRMAAIGLAGSWIAVSLVQSVHLHQALQPSQLMSVGIFTALALALLPFRTAVTLSAGSYLAVWGVALLTGTANALTLLVLGSLLAMLLSTEYGERITHERARAEILEWMAQHDGLTGLLNRSATEQRLKEWLCTQRTGGCLLLLDLDNFKGINDQYGHQMGDHALQYTAQALGRLLRPGDLAGRWGGEEFVILLAGRTAAEAREAAAQLQEDLYRSPQAGLPSLTVSGGSVCVGEAAPPTVSALLSLADERLYCAKAAGRACIVWPAEEDSHRHAARLTCCSATS
ncbi:GGDEF domain-containing protein [Deinococcus piscis]|uniref:GGDEF domain-containing protein n=1 Tax=Deinococcus piscis TaxID=394230 RepID=A0ABQ3K379_9DEIO|nr:GGDEF domain-containing protein [Deinococcus piscis]GHG01751.1 GGDEF domain-containing protein [Deinococcus piscis]